MIFGCGFIRGSEMFQFLNNLKDAVALFERFVKFEAQLGRVFENDGLADEALDALALPVELRESRTLLPGIAEYADINGGFAEVAADVDIVHRNQACFTDGDFTTYDFTDFTL